MSTTNEAVPAVVSAVVVAGLFILSFEGQTRVFAIVGTSSDARDAANAHLTHRKQNRREGKPHA